VKNAPPGLSPDNFTGLLDPFGLAGTLLEGQYRVDAMVGEGGFGVVYKGRHLSLEQPIAIKVLKGLDGGDAAINALVLEKFRAEARLLYKLSQSSLHIVRALDFGATTMPSGIWAPFMVLEWLDGRSLADDLAERRARGMRGRSVEEALAILEPVADGLAAAHRQQVAHRDVKPANVFLLADSGGPRVKVLDFGIAKIMTEGEAVGTKGTFASFTWLYAAPEQLDPRLGATGLATDVYGFGLLLTELLTDRPPIDERDIVGILKTATNPSRRPTPRTLGANVPDEIETVCQRALAVDPKSRYSNVAELWAALFAARGAHVPTVAQPSVVVRPRSAVAIAPPSTVRAGSTPDAMAQTSLVSPGSDPTMAAVPPRPAAPSVLSAPRVSAIRMSSPSLPKTPQGGWPLSSPQPSMLSPPPGTSPPRTMIGAVAPHPSSPSPGPSPLGRADGSNALVIVTTVFFVFALLFAGTCAVVHTACGH
jgi:serine/threonine protein kinase